jgi:hypothetical protein
VRAAGNVRKEFSGCAKLLAELGAKLAEEFHRLRFFPF